ncbi:nickel/cobalt efflux transporter [Asticcacaulis sp. EMRT-3]|uniref:nickel/cobalt efflux transporter n=1 Tax=Asticcacaulis sp. EMRT-3 TaxID=3040349 RepID=UPI0024AF4C3A|nr:nickel/cobalt efflux transporter [Asticcacaulis sp. EMRT-3]MDI7776614.1 nickel/cobalt efflux transporter [Asticcacaulis sp. EMRT-3]
MNDFAHLLQQGAGNAWLFIPSAILLGALHGLEPGHSKTMMAAFIVAVRGTIGQAVLLGLSATVSHTLIVWLIALGGLYLGQSWDSEAIEPYFQVASAVIMLGVALWMIWRTWSYQRGDHGHDHSHGHAHDETKHVETGHGRLRLEIFEKGQPPRFRLYRETGQSWQAGEVQVETVREDGRARVFTFVQKNGFLESVDDIPEPHEFKARLVLGHAGHSHSYSLDYEEHHHHHDEDLAQSGVMAGFSGSEPYADDHEREHAEEIERRFAGQKVTTPQIIMFGLTGGLIPCPASITVLLLCLQLKRIALGATLVFCFSIGLALTMVASGVLAAWSVKHVSKRFKGFGKLANRAPYLSGGLIVIVALYIGFTGLRALVH